LINSHTVENPRGTIPIWVNTTLLTLLLSASSNPLEFYRPNPAPLTWGPDLAFQTDL